jgi:hypothetical protein
MGLEFKTEEQRNPTNVPAPVVQKTKCEAELEMMTNFLQDNGYIMLYDQYKIIIQEREEQARLDRENNGFQEV